MKRYNNGGRTGNFMAYIALTSITIKSWHNGEDDLNWTTKTLSLRIEIGW